MKGGARVMRVIASASPLIAAAAILMASGDAPTRAEGTLTARFTATPVQGATCVAPCAVHFDAIGDGTSETTDAAFDREFHELLFEWNFGDPKAGEWEYGPRPLRGKNRAIGAIAGHVYDQPGSYEVLLSVTNPNGDRATHSHRLLVADPADAFPASRTFCLSTQPGAFRGCPLDSDADGSCERRPSHCVVGDDADDFLFEVCNADASNGIACLFRGGDRFLWDEEHPGPLRLAASPPAASLLGSFGEGAATLETRGAFTLLGGGASWTVARFAIEFDPKRCRGIQYHDGDVDVATSTIAARAHGFATGEGPHQPACNGSNCRVAPPLEAGGRYWIIATDANRIQLAASREDAGEGRAIKLLDPGKSWVQMLGSSCGLVNEWSTANHRVTLYDLDLRNVSSAAVTHATPRSGGHADLIAIVEVDVAQRSVGGGNGAGFFLKGERMLLMGGRWDDNYVGEFNLRTAHFAKSVIQHVRMLRPSNQAGPGGRRSNINLRAWGLVGSKPDEHIIVSDNVLSHDDSMTWIRTCRQLACGEEAEESRDIIIERNFAFLSGRGAAFTHGFVWSASADITIRNNIVDLRGIELSSLVTLFSRQGPSSFRHERVQVLHNTAYHDEPSQGLVFMCGGSGGEGWVCRNNLAYLPAQVGAASATHGSWEGGGNLFATINPFAAKPPTPPEAEAFRLRSPNSASIDAGVAPRSTGSWTALDHWGGRRTGKPDIGAHELGAEPGPD